jgi:antitoxin component of RelBE/YafQ-DinJ toxin-antitoxin module
MLAAMAEKKAILNLRLDPKVRDEFATAAKLRGASMSGLIHQFIVKTIREEKAEAPQAFRIQSVTATTIQLAEAKERSGRIVAHISPGKDPKDEVRRMVNDQEIGEIERRLKPKEAKSKLGK